MTQHSPTTARAFVAALELPAASRSRAVARGAPVAVSFDPAKDQALVVGSEVVSFVKGVADETRQDIVNGALLAQLAANKKVADRSDIVAWYDAYFDVLAHIGWVIQDRALQAYEEEADGLTAHEAILKVAAVLLGPSPAALAVVTSTVEAMRSLDADNPWITIFNREAQSANCARFQFVLAETDAQGRIVVSIMAFGLRADASLTQVLFFKIRKNKVGLKQCAGKATINETVLAGVREAIRTKLAGRIADYVDSLDI